MANINKTKFDSKHYWEVNLGYAEIIRQGIDKIEVSWEEILSSPAAQQIKLIDKATHNIGEFTFSESLAGDTANYKVIKGAEQESVWKEREEYAAPGQPLETFWQVHNIPYLSTWQVVVTSGGNIIAMTDVSSNNLTKSDAYAITEIDWGKNATPFWGGVAPRLLRGPTVHVDDSASTGEKIYSLIIKEREKIKYEIRLEGTKTIAVTPPPSAPPPAAPPSTPPPAAPPGPTSNHSLFEWSNIANALANGAKGFFKKMIGNSDPIGILTVVSPELITRKNFDATNPNSTSDSIMKVPAKNFYNYLGHWLTPDIGLKNGTYTDPYFENEEYSGRGLGIGPFSYDENTSTYNDLTKGLDLKIHSTSAPIARKISPKGSPGVGEIGEVHLLSESPNTELDPSKSPPDSYKETHYHDAQGKSFSYTWENDYNSHEKEFEIGAEFDLDIDVNCGHVPGSYLTGELNPTGCKILIWCGDDNDYNSDDTDSATYYKVPVNFNVPSPNPNSDFGGHLKRYYNPLFSTGYLSVSNDGKIKRTIRANIDRSAYSRKIKWHVVIYARGGSSALGIMSLINSTVKQGVNWLISLLDGISGLVPEAPPVGTRVWEMLVAPIQFLSDVLDEIVGSRHQSRATVTITSVKKYKNSFISTKSHPAILNFKSTDENAYLYTQFEYPNFDRSACFPDTMNYSFSGKSGFFRKPFLNNKVIENPYYWENSYDYKLSRKYLYYVPNLFRLTFETRQGVFLEQLAKQHKNNNISLPLSFQVKQHLHSATTDPAIVRTRETVEENLDDLFFPTNSDKWNVFIENGWGDTATAMNLTFLQNFIPSATVPANQQAVTIPPEYDSVFSDYPFLDVSTISEINKIIGNHNDIKHILESDVGYELNTWTQACADASQFSTLSSGTPKNLSFKIIEFILWYLDQDGIAFKTRHNVKSLIDYETYLDQIIKDNRGSSGDNLDDYHIIGTELYERECKE